MTGDSQMKHSLRHIPSGIWVLGFVSLLMDISSEIIHSLLPLFMVTILGTSAMAVGLVEGLAESLALVVKVFSGTLSDYLGKRKGLAVFGYTLGAFTKPLFAVASGIDFVLTARLLDRVGKGVRGAPRDAMVADIAPPHLRGAAFGLRQSLDTVGALLGPLLAVGLMLLWANDFRAVFWVAVIPGLMAVGLLLFGIQEPVPRQTDVRTNPIRRDNLLRLGSAYWWVVGIGAVFTLARFSEAFLVLRAQHGRDSHRLSPSRHSCDESDLCRISLSFRQALRSDESHEAAHTWASGSDCGRFGLGCEQSLGRCRLGRWAVGPSYGHDSRLACHHGRRHSTRRSTRDGVWLLQPRQRPGDADCQCTSRIPVGSVWRIIHILCRGRVLRDRCHGTNPLPAEE